MNHEERLRGALKPRGEKKYPPEKLLAILSNIYGEEKAAKLLPQLLELTNEHAAIRSSRSRRQLSAAAKSSGVRGCRNPPRSNRKTRRSG